MRTAKTLIRLGRISESSLGAKVILGFVMRRLILCERTAKAPVPVRICDNQCHFHTSRLNGHLV